MFSMLLVILLAILFFISNSLSFQWISHQFMRLGNHRGCKRHYLDVRSSSRLSSSDNDADAIPDLTKEPPLKVLLVVEPTPFNYISGYANRFKEMLDHLHIAGDEVHVITTDGSKSPPTTYKNYSITNLRGVPVPQYKAVRLSIDTRWHIKRLIKRLQPDIIHVSTPSFIFGPTIIWAKFFGIPLLMSYHTHILEYVRNYFGGLPREMLYAFFRNILKVHNLADLTLCTSPQLAQELRDLGINNVDVWLKGINTKIFSPEFKSESMRVTLSDNHPEDPLLVYIGRLGPEKRLDRLKAVLEAIPEARLAFVGSGPAEDNLKSIFSGYKVKFMGSLTGRSLSEAYASSDIFVMPSDSETLGFVVLEAMASGLPVVGVNAGGLPDIINHERNGFLVENNDNMSEFVKYVKVLVSDLSKRATIGKSARKWAESWSWEAATSKLRNIHYRRAIRNHQEMKFRKNMLSRNDKDAIDVNREYELFYRPDLAI